MKDYKELEIWKEGRKLVQMIYELTKNFPQHEIYGLASQAQRAAISQFANVSEGLGRKYKKETVHFLSHARGSLYELDAEMIAALDQHYFSELDYNDAQHQIQLVIRLINGTISYFEKANFP